MSELDGFRVSTPSRHPAINRGYDSRKHRYRSDYVNPKSWELGLTPFPAFFLGLSKIPEEIAALEWKVKQLDGKFVKKVLQPVRSGGFPGTTRKTVDVPAPGKYEITLQATRKDGRKEVSSRLFELRDLLIVGLGDSFASGQGNPDVAAVPSLDQKAMCKATTFTAFVLNQKAQLERFFNKLAQEGEKKLKEGIELVPVLGKVVVAGLEGADDVLSAVKGRISDLNEWTVDVARKVESVAVEGVEEVAGFFGIGDGGEFDETKPHGASWQEPMAYRSYRSGQSLAAAEIETQSAEGADRVTFLSFARTGSEVKEGLLGPRMVAADLLGKDVGLGRLSLDTWVQDRGQIEEARDTLEGRRPDAVVISIGVNDLGFSTHVTESILKKSGAARQERIAAAREKIAGEFPGNLNLLKEAIDKELRPRKVFISEYPVGIFKEVAVKSCGILKSFLGKDFNVSPPEANDMTMLGELLNSAIRSKAEEFGWILVDGIAHDFNNHGYCADLSYFVSAEDSCLNQGDFEGVFHPNKRGHKITRDRIASALKRELSTDRERWLEPILSVMMR